MLIYKQRYKPRTSREFTKSDLTVYDSAGNTALNALTVYGKSEVVDGAIVSAGEGWSVVRLADLTWNSMLDATSGKMFFFTIQPGVVNKAIGSAEMMCAKYRTVGPDRNALRQYNKAIAPYNTSTSMVAVRDDDYATLEDFVASLGNATLCYQLADPTQGNTIAVKTDDGTGIGGTMATFSTGTPLRGIPDTDVRDIMQWDGSAGMVTKNCGKVDLGTLNWTYLDNRFITTTGINDIKSGVRTVPMLCAKYTALMNGEPYPAPTDDKVIYAANTNICIHDSDYTDPADFKTAMNGVKLVYELATPTTEQLTSTENTSIAGLRTFTPQTHVQNNAQTDMTVDYTIRVPTI